MRIRMRVAMTGARGGEPWPGPGQTMIVGDEEAYALQRAGIADVVPDDDDLDQSVPKVHEASGRAVEDVVEAERVDAARESVDERPVETAVESDGETAATETGTSAQRKAARVGRGRE